VMIGGRILQIGPAGEVFRAPTLEAVARFVGLETILDARVVEAGRSGAVVEAAGRRLLVTAPAAPGERVLLALRPEDLHLAPPYEASAARNCLTGRVTHVIPAPLHVRVVIDCGVPVIAVVTHRTAAELALAPEMPVAVSFAPEAPHLLRADGVPSRGAASLDTATRAGV